MTSARDAGWIELADWLGTKVGGGIKKVETVTEVQMERKLRFGMMSIRDKIRDFVQAFIMLVTGDSTFTSNTVNTCPIGTPSWVQELKHEKISLSKKFEEISENHYRYGIYLLCAVHI
jgi:hypothetical protein